MASLKSVRRRRGATMVEAVVGLTVLVAFFAVLLFCFRAQENRIDAQADAYRDALEHASGGCEGVGDISSGPKFTVDREVPAPAVSVARQRGDERIIERRISTAHAKRTRSIAVGRMTSTATSEATFACDERPITEGPRGFFDYGLTTYRSYTPDKVKVR